MIIKPDWVVFDWLWKEPQAAFCEDEVCSSWHWSRKILVPGWEEAFLGVSAEAMRQAMRPFVPDSSHPPKPTILCGTNGRSIRKFSQGLLLQSWTRWKDGIETGEVPRNSFDINRGCTTVYHEPNKTLPTVKDDDAVPQKTDSREFPPWCAINFGDGAEPLYVKLSPWKFYRVWMQTILKRHKYHSDILM